jgi:hypothetical protein
MANVILADFVKESSTTTGTGTYSLAGAVAGHQGFVGAGCAGAQVPYVVTNGTDYEIGLGTVTDDTTDTLSRDAIYASSNAGAAVSWSAGTRDVYLAQISGKPSPVHTITGNTTLSYVHDLVLCNSASALTVTLPAAASYAGKEFTITNINTGVVTVDANSTETIRDPLFGSAETLLLYCTYDSIKLVSDGTVWWVISKNLRPHSSDIVIASATSITGGSADTLVPFDTISEQTGISVDLSQSYETLVNRSGKYLMTAHMFLPTTDGQAIRLQVTTSGGTALAFNRATSAGTYSLSCNISEVTNITAGTRVGLLCIWSGTATNSNATVGVRPRLQLVEQL